MNTKIDITIRDSKHINTSNAWAEIVVSASIEISSNSPNITLKLYEPDREILISKDDLRKINAITQHTTYP
jgi:hypothetical protein